MRHRAAAVIALAALTLWMGAGGGPVAAQDPADRSGAAPSAIGPERPPERPDADGDADATTDRAIPSAASDTAPLPRETAPQDSADTTAPPGPTGADDADPATDTARDAAIDPPAGPPRPSDADHAACLLALSFLGTDYTEPPAITDPGNPACGIPRPVRVVQIVPGVALQGGADMTCDTARALALWTQFFVKPAALMMPGAPRLTGMQTGTTYDCRARIGTGDATPKLSEHAQGAAIDIAAFMFDTADALPAGQIPASQAADTIPVAPRADTGDMAQAFQRAVRGSACLFFTTVLGPGSNAAHDNHLHLDVIARKNGWRLCQ